MRAIGRGRSLLVALCAIGASVLACSGPAATPSAPSSGSSNAPAAVTYTYGTATTQPPGSILITMSNYQFTPATLSLPAGRVVLYLVNTSNLDHDLILREPARSLLKVVAKSELVPPGQAGTLTIDALAAGIYHVTCAVGGHADLGMVGDFTIR